MYNYYYLSKEFLILGIPILSKQLEKITRFANNISSSYLRKSAASYGTLKKHNLAQK